MVTFMFKCHLFTYYISIFLFPLSLYTFFLVNWSVSLSYIFMLYAMYHILSFIDIISLSPFPTFLFHSKLKRKFEFIVQGRFLKPVPFSTVYTGQVSGICACMYILYVYNINIYVFLLFKLMYMKSKCICLYVYICIWLYKYVCIYTSPLFTQDR